MDPDAHRTRPAGAPGPRARGGGARSPGGRMKSRCMLALVVGMSLSPLLVPLLAPSAALAQEEDAAESRAESFQAAEGAQTENIPGGMLMVGAYGVTLVLLLGYVVSIGMRQARTARELDRLRADLSKREG
ncbi:MAG TPA: hypothetical protein DEF51_39040 [Myxococcales bacterium]|nr:hypothetical protein [Myxococcales bacterium]